MQREATTWHSLWLLLILSACAGESESGPVSNPDEIRVPAGFAIEVVADVPNARSLALGENGTLFVSSIKLGLVRAVRNPLGENPEVLVIASNLRSPNGIAMLGGDLYVAEPTRITRLADIESRLDERVQPELVIDGLLAGPQHSWKYLAAGPDGKLYVSIGAPCNVCDEPDYGLIQRLNPDGTELEVVARGIRNSVGFDWHPATGELWFTDNNRDNMGDDIPPGELNRVREIGAHFGFPFCHGSDIVEPEPALAALGSCSDSTPPAQLLGPHVAALGMAFYDGEQFPEAYHNQVFIAEHGSWNRSKKIGYRVTLVRLRDGRGVAYEPFVSGWLRNEQVSGRPVDVVVSTDGSLFVSDDRAGKVYRIHYIGDGA